MQIKRSIEGQDSHLRSIAKAISWRMLATVTTFVLVFLFTNEVVLAFGVGIFDMLFKIVLYYLHERVWNGYKLGKRLRVHTK